MLNVKTVISCACTVQCILRDKQYKHTCAGHQEHYIHFVHALKFRIRVCMHFAKCLQIIHESESEGLDTQYYNKT